MDIILREYSQLIRQRWGWFLLVMLGVSGSMGLDVIAPLFYKEIANGLAQPFNPTSQQLVLSNFVYVALCYAGIWLSWRAAETGMIQFESKGLNTLDKRCFQVLIQQRYAFFENNFAGSLVKQANRFIKSFETIIDWLIFQFYGSLLMITTAVIIFYQQQPAFAWYFLVWAVFFIAWSIGFPIWKLRFDLRVAEMDSKLGGAYSDGISNIAIVKSFALEQQEFSNIQTLADESWRKRNLAWLLMFISFAVQGIMVFGIELFLVYQMIGKWEQGQFAIGEFVLFQSVLLLLIRHLWDFGRDFRRFFTALADAREMADVFRQADIETQQGKQLAIKSGNIRFEHIQFGYADKRLFNDFNLNIKAGEKIALVGHSGSGKTSLTKLLFRFIEPQQGTLQFDGQNAQDFSLTALRSQIALVPQQPELFHRSIRDNITLGKNITEAQLRNVAQQANALAFIESLPQGFDTLVGERGIKLSGGEKQRIALARAFLENAPIVVLDEATSALDSITEQQIQTAIFTLIEHKTAIVIAHRLATILRMDRIIVLENGQIVEQGKHHELLALNGRYAEMWKHQSGEFLNIA